MKCSFHFQEKLCTGQGIIYGGGSGVVGTIHCAWNIDIESCVKSTIVAGPKFTCNVQKSQISTACHYLQWIMAALEPTADIVSKLSPIKFSCSLQEKKGLLSRFRVLQCLFQIFCLKLSPWTDDPQVTQIPLTDMHSRAYAASKTCSHFNYKYQHDQKRKVYSSLQLRIFQKKYIIFNHQTGLFWGGNNLFRKMPEFLQAAVIASHLNKRHQYF